MRALLSFLLFALPAGAMAQAEDSAHRADRLQTAGLNRSAAQAVEKRDAADAAALSRYQRAVTDYQREREAWRRRFAACEAGDERACTRP